jgi:hypothetical protein
MLVQRLVKFYWQFMSGWQVRQRFTHLHWISKHAGCEDLILSDKNFVQIQNFESSGHHALTLFQPAARLSDSFVVCPRGNRQQPLTACSQVRPARYLILSNVRSKWQRDKSNAVVFRVAVGLFDGATRS